MNNETVSQKTTKKEVIGIEQTSLLLLRNVASPSVSFLAKLALEKTLFQMRCVHHGLKVNESLQKPLA